MTRKAWLLVKLTPRGLLIAPGSAHLAALFISVAFKFLHCLTGMSHLVLQAPSINKILRDFFRLEISHLRTIRKAYTFGMAALDLQCFMVSSTGSTQQFVASFVAVGYHTGQCSEILHKNSASAKCYHAFFLGGTKVLHVPGAEEAAGCGAESGRPLR